MQTQSFQRKIMYVARNSKRHKAVHGSELTPSPLKVSESDVNTQLLHSCRTQDLLVRLGGMFTSVAQISRTFLGRVAELYFRVGSHVRLVNPHKTDGARHPVLTKI